MTTTSDPTSSVLDIVDKIAVGEMSPQDLVTDEDLREQFAALDRETRTLVVQMMKMFADGAPEDADEDLDGFIAWACGMEDAS